jgi:hypothetical protein
MARVGLGLQIPLLICACSRAPAVEDVPVTPCRITTPSRFTTFEYDARGRQVKRADHTADGSLTTTWTFTYDGDRMIEHTVSGGGSPLTFALAYDAEGHHISTTAMTRVPRVDWRGRYEGDLLVEEFDVRGASSTRTMHEYDRRGRRVKDTAHYVRFGTSITEYTYDDSFTCKRYARPMVLPGQPPAAPCPISERVTDANGTRETRLQYRDGRLVDDGSFVYVHDRIGRLIREHSIRVPDAISEYAYDCE